MGVPEIQGEADHRGEDRRGGGDQGIEVVHENSARHEITIPSDDEIVHCDRHGRGRIAFVCQHLVGSSGRGFFHSDNGPYPDAWCADCDAMMMETGHWTEEAEKVAGISIVCHRCYVNIRRRYQLRKE